MHTLKKTLVATFAATAVTALASVAAHAQMFIGGGAGLTVVPHTGEAFCGDRRDASSAATAELRLGVILGPVNVSARGALMFGRVDRFVDQCVHPPGTRVTIYSYPRDRQAHSVDLNAWYDVQRHLKVGAELGAFPGQSQYAGAGVALNALGLHAEILGRIHRVILTTSLNEVTSTGPPIRIATSEGSELALGLSVRVVFVGY